MSDQADRAPRRRPTVPSDESPDVDVVRTALRMAVNNSLEGSGFRAIAEDASARWPELERRLEEARPVEWPHGLRELSRHVAELHRASEAALERLEKEEKSMRQCGLGSVADTALKKWKTLQASRGAVGRWLRDMEKET